MVQQSAVCGTLRTVCSTGRKVAQMAGFRFLRAAKGRVVHSAPAPYIAPSGCASETRPLHVSRCAVAVSRAASTKARVECRLIKINGHHALPIERAAAKLGERNPRLGGCRVPTTAHFRPQHTSAKAERSLEVRVSNQILRHAVIRPRDDDPECVAVLCCLLFQVCEQSIVP